MYAITFSAYSVIYQEFWNTSPLITDDCVAGIFPEFKSLETASMPRPFVDDWSDSEILKIVVESIG